MSVCPSFVEISLVKGYTKSTEPINLNFPECRQRGNACQKEVCFEMAQLHLNKKKTVRGSLYIQELSIMYAIL